MGLAARLVGAIPEIRSLVLLVLLAGSAWVFIEIADEVHEGEKIAFDHAVMDLLRSGDDRTDPVGPAWLEETMRDVTALGSLTLIGFVTASVWAYLVMARQPGAATLLLAAVLGAILWSSLLKLGFDRARPDFIAANVTVYTASFPSGHATGAAATYLTLGALLARFQRRRRIGLFVMGLGVVITVAVGVSRVYLGVHWPSDVIAGWTLGGGWALLCWLLARHLQNRRLVGGAD